MGELNIPPFSRRLLDKRQEEIGLATEAKAMLSVDDALKEEVMETTK